MADTAIVEHTELALASVVRDRALLYDSLMLVLAFGPCFACSCDQKVLTCLLVSSRRSFYIVRMLKNTSPTRGLVKKSARLSTVRT